MTDRRWLAGAVIAALAIVTTALVGLALRPPDVTIRHVVPLEQGAVAASGGSAWRWTGPLACNADADAIPSEHSEGGGAWRPAPIPLANVQSLSFGDASRGVATGTTGDCARGVAVTSDGGRTWRYRDDNPVLLDAWFAGDLVWGIELVIGEPRLATYRVHGERLLPEPGVDAQQPCTAGDGPPVEVAFWDGSTGLILCQSEVSGGRLLARTTNAGANFERLTDDRPETGLDSAAPVLDIDVVGTTTVFALLGPNSECREGQLRVSDTQGASFRRLPCPSRSADVDDVLDVAFTSERDGLLLGVRNDRPVVLTSDDGGATWHR